MNDFIRMDSISASLMFEIIPQPKNKSVIPDHGCPLKSELRWRVCSENLQNG